ncbi:MAG: GNAT family N-acetyltransferase [Bacteroidota bacterium]
MELKTLGGVDKKELLKVFNRSFSDYFIPFKLTEEQLTSKMLADKIDLELSVGVFENEKPIAFMLHGFDRIDNLRIVYNGGTGVIPNKRGLGLTKRMYRFILPNLAEKRVNKIVLEVIDKNIQAIKSYRKSGFKTTRALACYKGDFKILKTNKQVAIKNLESYSWGLMETFWDIHPTWQNSNNVLSKLQSQNSSLGAYIKNELVGYVIFNPVNKRIKQIAINKDFRKKAIASALISELAKKHGNTFSVINVDKKSESINKFFNAIGLENYIDQLEMELKIDAKYS